MAKTPLRWFRVLPRYLIGLVIVVLLIQASSCCCCLGGAVTPPMTPFSIDRAQAESLRERVRQAAAVPGPVTLTVSDQELTSYLVGLAQSGEGEFPARDMKLAFGDGHVDIWATFTDIAPTDMPVYVRARVQAVNGQAVFYIEQVHAGPFPLPGAMREAVSQCLSETLAELGLALRIDQIEIRPGEMMLRGEVTGHLPDLPIYAGR